MPHMESELEGEVLARISVLEFLVAHLFNMKYQEMNASVDWVKKQHELVRKQVNGYRVKGLDAANAEAMSQEMDTALDDFLTELEGMYERYSQIGKQ